MTAPDLAALLKVCRDARLAAVVLKMGGDEVHATFEPEPMPAPDIAAGGWKGPIHLDAPEAFDVAEAPRSVE